jgi:hypothetical protein
MSLTLDGGTGNITGLNVETGNLPAGSILQVVQGSTSTQVVITSTSFQDIGLQASITTTQANSKILILASVQFRVFKNETSGDQGTAFKLLRDSTSILEDENNYAMGYAEESGVSTRSFRAPFNFFDSPNASSGTTIVYKIQGLCRAPNGANSVEFQDDGNYSSIIHLFEVSA